MATTVRELRRIGACAEAIEWAERQPSPASAWRACGRGDWMLWIVGRMACKYGSAAHPALVLCACEVARTALRHVPAARTASLRASANIVRRHYPRPPKLVKEIAR